jgi:hypothetical protein
MTVYRWRSLSIVLLVAVLALLLMASSASAGTVAGKLVSWSPRQSAPESGWTKIVFHEVLGENGGSLVFGPRRTYRARNNVTVFRRMVLPDLHLDRVSRTTFFRIVKQYSNNVTLGWGWRGSSSGRYRYVRTITAIYAGGG